MVDEVRTKRLVDWYYVEKEQQWHQTMLLVAAILGSEQLNSYVERYRKVMFPSEKTNAQLIEKYADIIDDQAEQVFDVSRQWLPGEER